MYDADPGHAVGDEQSHTVWLMVLRSLLPDPPAEILDVGTGTGVLALLMAERDRFAPLAVLVGEKPV